MIIKKNEINISSVASKLKIIKNFERKPLKGGMPAIEKNIIIINRASKKFIFNIPSRLHKNKLVISL